MKILNIVVTELCNGDLISIDSFIIKDKTEDIKNAEDFFKLKLKNNKANLTEDELEDVISDGFYDIEESGIGVFLSWSNSVG